MPAGSIERTNARKEEIFLALWKREYDNWITALREMMEENENMTNEEIAAALAKKLEERQAMTKAGVDYTYSSLYELTYHAALSMLKN